MNNRNGNGPFPRWLNRILVTQVPEAGGPHDEWYSSLIEADIMRYIRWNRGVTRWIVDIEYYEAFRKHGANWWQREVISLAHLIVLVLFGGWNIRFKRWMRKRES